jgi:hypothetical protein
LVAVDSSSLAWSARPASNAVNQRRKRASFILDGKKPFAGINYILFPRALVGSLGRSGHGYRSAKARPVSAFIANWLKISV